MFLTKICVILISVAFFCGLTEQASLNNTEPFPLKLRPDSDIGPHQLVYLGTVDGAVYYVELEKKRNWTDAKKLCEGFEVKLKLATVMSKAQNDFLMKNLQQEWVWLGAEEDITEKSFRWEGTVQNAVNYNQNFYSTEPRHWCLGLRTRSDLKGLSSHACSALHPTLCQLQT